MLTKKTMDDFLAWMKENSNEKCKERLAYGVRAGVNCSGYLMQAVTIYHDMSRGNHILGENDKYLLALCRLFKQEKLDYYLMTPGAYYSEAFVYDPANSGFARVLDTYDLVDDELTFTSDVSLNVANSTTTWATKYGNISFMPESLSIFTEVER